LSKSCGKVLAAALTYKLVGYLKRVEREDFFYDVKANFTPFSLGA
jgi:hypothetical protein